NYKAVGFDYGGVIYGKPGHEFETAVAELLDISIDQFKSAYFKHNKNINLSKVSEENFWRLVLAELNKQDELYEIQKFINEWDSNKSFNDEILSLTRKLRGSKFKTGLLSNNTLEAAQFMREAGLESLFDVFHISAETGYVKPDIIAFNHFADM